MESPPRLGDEAERLNDLKLTAVLDTAPEPEFDDLAQLAAAVTGKPMALVSLIDRDRQWFKARIGVDVRQSPRNTSFCTHTIGDSEPFIVRDAAADPRFANNPWVLQPPHVRFYAGVALRIGRGHAVGALCVLSDEPGDLDPNQVAALMALGRRASAVLDQRRRHTLMASVESILHGMNQDIETPHRIGDYVSQMLAVGNQILSTTIGVVSQIDDDAYTVLHVDAPPDTVQVGDQFPLASTFCGPTVASDSVVCVAAVSASDLAGTRWHTELGLESYLSAPLKVGGRRIGTLSFSSPEPHEGPWCADARTLLGQMSQRLGHALDAGDHLFTQARVLDVVANKLPGSVAYLDADMRLRFVNRRVAEWYGEEQEVLLGSRAASWLDPENATRVTGLIDEALRGRGHREIIEGRTFVNGERLDVESSYLPDVDGTGAVRGVIALGLDVASQRRTVTAPAHDPLVATIDTTELQRQKRALDRFGEDLQQLAYAASHDMREVLRMVSNYLELLEPEITPHLKPEGLRDLDYVRLGCSRLGALVDSLVWYLRLDRGLSAADNTALDEVLDKVLYDASDRLVGVEATVERGPLPVVWGDAVQLAQLFTCLLDNSLKFSNGQPPKLRFDAEPVGEEGWQVRMSDNGLGVGPKFAAKAFDVFTRGHSRDRFEGTGVGLAVARRIVENHGGRIWFDPAYTDGAQVRFTLATHGH